MNKIVKLININGPELRTRASVSLLKKEVHSEHVIFDFSGITFMSRSYADEFCTLIEALKGNYEFIHESAFVSTTLRIVSQGRKTNRVHRKEDASIANFKTMQELSHFLQTF